MGIYKDLIARGLIFQTTSETIEDQLSQPISLYAGFDPTADSLHVGHLLPLITLSRFKKFGHNPIFLIGGATGLIGDPSGKSEERVLHDKDKILNNSRKITEEVNKIFGNIFTYRNNIEWSENISVLDFFREIGKHFSINEMIKKESVQKRLNEREQGISFTEFSYSLLQANDFLELNKSLDCSLQIGGSDQWGNIVAGIDLIHKKLSKRTYGITLPLLLNSNGKKFGKSESGNIWLSPEKTSPFDFYQFWIRTSDEDVVKFLKYFTFLSTDDINEIEKQHLLNLESRKAQRILADEMSTLIHGKDCLLDILKCNQILYENKNIVFEIGEIFYNLRIPKVEIELNVEKENLIEILFHSTLFPSKAEIKRKVEAGAVFLNNKRITNVDLFKIIDTNQLLAKNFLLLRKGKKDYKIIQITTPM